MNATPADIDRVGAWQCGPPWQKLSFADWPISQDCPKVEIPQEELNSPLFAAYITTALISTQSFDTERFKNKPLASCILHQTCFYCLKDVPEEKL